MRHAHAPDTGGLFTARFTTQGIGSERLALHGPDSFQEYLRRDNGIDITLEPLPSAKLVRTGM